MRSARLDARIYWDLGFVKQCSICGLLVPIFTAHGPRRGTPVAHYPVLNEHAYIEGGFCRGGSQPAVPPSEAIEVA